MERDMFGHYKAAPAEIEEDDSPKPELKVLVKSVYGRECFYPRNSTAKTLCELMKTHTFTKDQMRFCKDKGWKIHVQTEEYNL